MKKINFWDREKYGKLIFYENYYRLQSCVFGLARSHCEFNKFNLMLNIL